MQDIKPQTDHMTSDVPTDPDADRTSPGDINIPDPVMRYTVVIVVAIVINVINCGCTSASVATTSAQEIYLFLCPKEP